jgi:hypothetical protein
MGQRAFVQARALAKGACSLVAPTVKDQRYIAPGLACACGLYLGDPAPGPPSRSSPRSWGRASVGDGDDDQDHEELQRVGD